MSHVLELAALTLIVVGVHAYLGWPAAELAAGVGIFGLAQGVTPAHDNAVKATLARLARLVRRRPKP